MNLSLVALVALGTLVHDPAFAEKGQAACRYRRCAL